MVGTISMPVYFAVDKVLSNWVTELCSTQEIIDSIARMGFPDCTGAVAGTHVTIISSSSSFPSPTPARVQIFMNTKGYSMVLQGLVDHHSRFIDITAESFGT